MRWQGQEVIWEVVWTLKHMWIKLKIWFQSWRLDRAIRKGKQPRGRTNARHVDEN